MTAEATVLDVISDAQTYASEALTNANSAITSLENVSIPSPNANVQWQNIYVSVPDISISDIPEAPSVTFTLPSFPSAPTLEDVYEPILSTPPDWDTIVGEAPSVDYTGTPVLSIPTLSATAPDENTYTYPDDLSVTLPSVPTLEDVTLPTLDAISLPTFTQSVPSFSRNLSNTFTYSDESYSSSLLTAVQAVLLDRIQNGGTGLDSDIEEAIWNRAKDRESQEFKRSAEKLSTDFSSKGWSVPSLTLYGLQQNLRLDYHKKLADISRDIAIKQAELEQSNVRESLSQVIQLEGVLIQDHQATQARLLDVAKFTFDADVQIFNSYVQVFNIERDIFAQYIALYDAQIRAELAKLEVFKGELDGQRLVNEINAQDIQLYLARIEGVQKEIDAYKSQIDAINSKYQGDQIRLQNYATRLDAWFKQLQGEQVKFEAFQAKLQAENLKLEGYDKQGEGFLRRLQAYTTNIDNNYKRSELDLNINRQKLEEFQSQLNSSVSLAEQQFRTFSTSAEVYKNALASYETNVRAQIAQSDQSLKVKELQLAEAQAEVDLTLEQSKVNIAAAFESAQLSLTQANALSEAASTLAAASLSAVNAIADISNVTSA